MKPSPQTRRAFLKTSLMGFALPAGLDLLWPHGWHQDRNADRSLILLELVGANDGLNTVVPYADDRYHRARPTLRHAESNVLRIDEHTGLAPSLKGLQALYEAGQICIAQGVGFPTVERSHFEGFRRWHQAALQPAKGAPGWLAPVLSRKDLDRRTLRALALGTRELPGLLEGTKPVIAAVDDLDRIVPGEAVRAQLKDPLLAAMDARVGDAAHQARVAAAQHLLQDFDRLARAPRAEAQIPDTALGRQVAAALRILHAGLAVPVIILRHEGYDTHARQGPVHAALLTELDAALSSLLRGLHQLQLNDRTLVLVHTEFGRRVAENGTRGTDHGAAAPIFLSVPSTQAPQVPAGLHGARPDLHALVEGDVRPTIDFREALALAAHWLGVTAPPSLLGPQAHPLFQPR